MDRKHYIFSLKAKNSGAFEHGWNLAKNLALKGVDVSYYNHWWDSPISEVNLETGETRPLDCSKLSGKEGVFHLQTHTWQYDGLLERIITNKNQKLIYNLHAIIPYFYMGEKQKKDFLDGKLDYQRIKEGIEGKMSGREKAQLELFSKVDYLFAISKNHKKVLDLMGVRTPTYVFENLSDLSSADEETFLKASALSGAFREKIGAENVLLYCGRVEKSKGSFGLFDSFRKVRSEFPSSKLILLGTGEDRAKKLLSLGLGGDLIGDIEFVPWEDKNTVLGKINFLKYYLSADVLVQPVITDELYSKTVIDAMSVGIPAITCKSPYTIGSSASADDIFKSFVFMKENPCEVHRITKLAKDKVMKENTWDSYISRLSGILRGD
jgi:glycosyltransferase involved in cell wall biosynthesis